MWTFWGSGFGWARNSLSLDAVWHEFLPDMTGPNPDFEVDEVLKLKSLMLSISFRTGGDEAARDEIRAHYRDLGKDLDEDRLPDFQSIVYVNEDHISVYVYRSEHELRELTNDFKAYGALAGPKHYRGHLRSNILAGHLSLGAQPAEKRGFLEGKIPGIILRDAPRVCFVSGTDLPAASDESSTLRAMQQQF